MCSEVDDKKPRNFERSLIVNVLELLLQLRDRTPFDEDLLGE